MPTVLVLSDIGCGASGRLVPLRLCTRGSCHGPSQADSEALLAALHVSPDPTQPDAFVGWRHVDGARPRCEWTDLSYGGTGRVTALDLTSGETDSFLGLTYGTTKLSFQAPSWTSASGGLQWLTYGSRGSTPAAGLHLVVRGSVDPLARLTELVLLKLDSSQVMGRVEALAQLHKLTVLDTGSCALTGNVGRFSNMPQLVTLGMQSAGLTGNISLIGASSNQLGFLALMRSPNVVGSIDHLAANSRLRALR
eukprot:COSAG05_NODE_3058_length_2374_cov_1.291868_1_plen_250_part_10